jgi:NACHT domain
MSTSYLSRWDAINFSQTIERLTTGFVGREWLFANLDDWLNNNQGEQFYILTGEPGVGKSAISAMLTKRWMNEQKPEEGKLAAYHFCRAGDVETVRPGRALRSIATQLGQTLPHYGKALKAVLDQVHLQIDVSINIDRLSNSQVTGIYIENLKELDPKEEFRLLIQAPLAKLVDIYKDLKIMPPAQKVFLIDSLDEAATTTGQENMMTLLGALYQARASLPPWVKFLCTTRPRQDVLQRFVPLQPEKIEELGGENLDDIQRYVQGRIDDELRGEPSPARINHTLVANQKPLQQRLDEAETTAEVLVAEVKELSRGNFLYTELLLNSIASGEQSIKNLASLPKNINDIYHRILRYRCSFRSWLKRYQPILGTLCVVQEPISQELLGKFLGIDAAKLGENLDIFRQFLDESKDEQGQTLYGIFHQSLRDYLLDRKHNYDFWCDGKEQHGGIIDFFDRQSEGWTELEAIDPYGLRHLAQHLVKGDRVDKLHELLSLNKGDKNAWFKLKDDEGDISGFLADVSLAWAQADELYDSDSSKSIGLQCRYALMKASINSLARIPKELMLALVKHSYWKPSKAYAYICQISDIKFDYLQAFADQLPDSEPIKQQLWKTALQLAKSTKSNYDRADALIVLADKLPGILPEVLETLKVIDFAKVTTLVDKLPDALLEILEFAKTSQNDSTFCYTLIAIADKLATNVPSKALELSRSIKDKKSRIELLIALANKIPEAIYEALETVQTMEYDSERAQALIVLTNKLPLNLIPKAFEITKSIQNDCSYYPEVLIALVGRLTIDLLPDAILLAKTIKNYYSRAKVLTVLADRMPEVIPDALEAIREICLEQNNSNSVFDFSYYSVVEMLIALADEITLGFLPKTLEIVQLIKDNSNQAKVLTALAGTTHGITPKALEAIQLIQHEYIGIDIFITLVDKLTLEFLPKALEIAKNFPGDGHCQALMALADKLPEALSKVLEAAQSIQDNNYRAQML